MRGLLSKSFKISTEISSSMSATTFLTCFSPSLLVLRLFLGCWTLSAAASVGGLLDVFFRCLFTKNKNATIAIYSRRLHRSGKRIAAMAARFNKPRPGFNFQPTWNWNQKWDWFKNIGCRRNQLWFPFPHGVRSVVRCRFFSSPHRLCGRLSLSGSPLFLLRCDWFSLNVWCRSGGIL